MSTGVIAQHQEQLRAVMEEYEDINFTTIDNYFATDAEITRIIAQADNIEKLLTKLNTLGPTLLFENTSDLILSIP